MAISYTLKTDSGYGIHTGRYLQLYCTQTPDIENNQSKINWTLSCQGGTSSYYSTGPTTVTINGTQVYYKKRVEWNTYETSTDVFPSGKAGNSVSGSLTVSHSGDGSKSISLSVKTAVYAGSSFAQTFSGTWTLDTIARKSTVTCSTADIGSDATINISRASSSFTHTLTYSFQDLTGTIATKTSNTSVAFTLPTSFYAKIPNNSSGTGEITCETFSGSTSIGTNTCSFTATVNKENNKPTISPTISCDDDTYSLTGDRNKFIKYYSSASFNTGVSAKNSASIKSVKITCGDKSESKTYSFTGTFSEVTTNTFTIIATDSRGFQNTETVTKTIVDYIPLSCVLGVGNISVGGAVTLEFSGKYFNGSFGSTSNTLTLQYRIKESGGSYGSWTTAGTPSKSNGNYSLSMSTTVDDSKTYVFQARAIDKIYTSGVNSTEISKSLTPAFDWGKSDFNFNVPVSLLPRIKRTRIPSNSDLNDYWKSGFYYHESNESAQTITNKPSYYSFILDVYSGLSDKNIQILEPWTYVTQKLETYMGEIFYRQGYTNSGTTLGWSVWQKVSFGSSSSIGFADLLWTNASPSSDFAMQNIRGLNLADYNFVLITCSHSVSKIIPTSGNLFYMSLCVSFNYYRQLYVDKASGIISFEDGRKQTAVGSSEINNASLKPLQIYGIR